MVDCPYLHWFIEGEQVQEREESDSGRVYWDIMGISNKQTL